ncbi:MAG: hypothetical protein Q9202_004392 [Teloschistes flavicans]
MQRFELEIYLQSIRRFKITEIPMVPTMLVAVLTSSLTDKGYLQSLRSVYVAGSPLRSSTQVDFQTLLHPDARVTQVWGMTETGWTTMFQWPETDNTGSVGRLVQGMSSKLVDEDGNILIEDNQEGELYIKGPSIMTGYFNDAVATATTIDGEGWLRTGDIAYSIQGKWYIVDRKKDIIKVHGWQVAPAELEAVLLTHPQVVNAAVIGIPTKDGTGEVPQAFVVLKQKPLDGTYASHGELEEHTTTAEELKKYLASRLAKYKALNAVTFVDDIPRTPSGKLQKFKLKEMYTNLRIDRKRKRDVLETIGDRNAAIRNAADLEDVTNCNRVINSNGLAENSDTTSNNGVTKAKDTTHREDDDSHANGIAETEVRESQKAKWEATVVNGTLNGTSASNGLVESSSREHVSNDNSTATQQVNGYNARKRVELAAG